MRCLPIEYAAVKPFYLRQPLRFSCTQCGRCCATAGEYYVYLSEAESETIREYLQLSRGWFRRRYLRRLANGERVLAASADERCIFLDERGRCRVYAARPSQCRSYPFWPELVATASAWRHEARRCEGIDHGEVVSPARIRRALQSCEPEA
jgi:Fe-S-cluster containining protein